MAHVVARRSCTLCKAVERLHLNPAAVTGAVSYEQIRLGTGKHYDPKWRALRSAKVFKIKLPNYDKIRREAAMTPEEMRSERKREGMLPPRTFQERNIVIASTNSVFEEFVPPEGDGRASMISVGGAKQKLTEIEKKGKSFLQLRKVRQYEEGFDTTEFAEQAQDIYKEACSLLNDVKENEDRLHDLVTEKAYPEMTWKMDKRTVRWSFVKSLEPPRAVHVRCTDMLSKDNVYGQVTVRMHTQQVLAIYDRFGRLMYGSEDEPRDCLEYVVMEKHLSDEYGSWRIHSKIVPDWMPPQKPVLKTFRKPKFDPIPDEEETSEKKEEDSTIDSNQNTPAFA